MIIGIAGLKGSGKNTVAEIVKKNFSDSWHITEWSFAEDLKKSAAHSLGQFDKEIEFCNGLKEKGSEISVKLGSGMWGSISGREFLQFYGTEAHRDIFGQGFWVENLFEKIGTAENVEDYGWKWRLDLITDTRFENEAEAVRNAGGWNVRVNRPSVESGDTHASEKPLEDKWIDYELDNSGSLQQLEITTNGIFKKITRPIQAERVKYA